MRRCTSSAQKASVPARPPGRLDQITLLAKSMICCGWSLESDCISAAEDEFKAKFSRESPAAAGSPSFLWRRVLAG
jgi:hypothetical protein